MTDAPALSAMDMAKRIHEQGGLFAPFILQGTDPNGHAQQFIFEGITLRQHYAGQAMAALITSPHTRDMEFAEAADRAFAMADAMLEAQK